MRRPDIRVIDQVRVSIKYYRDVDIFKSKTSIIIIIIYCTMIYLFLQ